MTLGNRRPVIDAGAAERIDAHTDPGAANGGEIHHVRQIIDVNIEEIVAMRTGCAQSALERDPGNASHTFLQQGVGAVFDPGGDIAVGRAPIGRVVFETAVFRRIMRRRDHDPIGGSMRMLAVVHQNRM